MPPNDPNGDWVGTVAVKTFQCDSIPTSAPFVGGGGNCVEFGVCFPGRIKKLFKTVKQ